MRLKELRKNKGVSQEQVAKDLNISMRAYQNYEYGQREPNIEMILKLAEYYDVTTDYLLGKESPSADPFENLKFTAEMEKEANEDYQKLTQQEKAVIAKIVKALADSHKEENNDYISLTTTIGSETERRATAEERMNENAKAENAAAG